MSSEYRTIINRSIFLGIPVGLIGMSFGALAVTAGISPVMACVMSMSVFAGGAQFAALAVVSGGGSVMAAVLSGLVLNSRFLAFGMTLAPRLGDRWPQRAAAAHLLVDESFAMALAEGNPHRGRVAFWCSGLLLFALWNVGTAIGVSAGTALGDPRDLGLDAALPAAMLFLVVPLLRTRRMWLAAVLGGGFALAAVPVVPSGVPILVAVLGALVALFAPGGLDGDR